MTYFLNFTGDGVAVEVTSGDEWYALVRVKRDLSDYDIRAQLRSAPDADDAVDLDVIMQGTYTDWFTNSESLFYVGQESAVSDGVFDVRITPTAGGGTRTLFPGQLILQRNVTR